MRPLDHVPHRASGSPGGEAQLFGNRHQFIGNSFRLDSVLIEDPVRGFDADRLRKSEGKSPLHSEIESPSEVITGPRRTMNDRNQTVVRHFVKWNRQERSTERREALALPLDGSVVPGQVLGHLNRYCCVAAGYVKHFDIGIHTVDLGRPRLTKRQPARVPDGESRKNGLRPCGRIAPSPINHRSVPMWIDRMICPIALRPSEVA